MARKRRIQTPGYVRHVLSRGNGRMQIFRDDIDFSYFIDVFGNLLEEFQIECWNYCLMPNHYHMTLQPAMANMSEAMRRGNSAYALWWNRRHASVGHVLQGRFTAQIVQDTVYLLALSRYVVLNPVRAGLCDRPENWPWSSYRATVGLSPSPSFLRPLSTLRLFGEGDEQVLQRRFQSFVEGPPEDPGVMNRLRSNERIIGDRGFKMAVESACAIPDPAMALAEGATASIGAPEPGSQITAPVV